MLEATENLNLFNDKRISLDLYRCVFNKNSPEKQINVATAMLSNLPDSADQFLSIVYININNKLSKSAYVLSMILPTHFYLHFFLHFILSYIA